MVLKLNYVQAILHKPDFITSLYICAFEIVLMTYGSEREFPWSIDVTKRKLFLSLDCRHRGIHSNCPNITGWYFSHCCWQSGVCPIYRVEHQDKERILL